ncbi:uncharacterized protein JCM15063_003024 [Sporobolomyces koalae]|uniref:uncharacterized protein n=1 Tax=Sporobolomyces koalae TaxID=500713 RepID=UPI0031717441
MSSYSRDSRFYFRPRLLSTASSARPRSNISIRSAASSTSSITGERGQRSAELLELELGSYSMAEDTPRRRSFRNSIVRAGEVIRASERQRELERRKERAGLRARQVGRSASFLEHFKHDTTEDLDIDEVRRKEHWSPDRLLRKARSIPSELLFSPASLQRSAGSQSPSIVKENLSRTELSAEYRTVNDALSIRPRFEPARERIDHLTPPAGEPTSKFSASSTDSLVHIALCDERPLGFKDVARSFSQSRLKTFGSKLKSKATSKTSLRQKTSPVEIFRDETSPPDTDRDMVKQSKRFPTRLGHRQNTSVSSSAPSTDSDKKRKVSSRLGFFRSVLRDSTSSPASEGRSRSSETFSPSIASGQGSESVSDRRSSLVTASSGSSSSPSVSKLGWATKVGRTIRGKNIAAKRAIFENGNDHERTSSVVQLAEKVTRGDRSPLANEIRPPSRVPLAALFSGGQAKSTSTTAQSPQPLVINLAAQPQTDPSRNGSARTYARRMDCELTSDSPRVRAKASSPPISRAPVFVEHASTKPRLVPSRSMIAAFSDLALLPAADIVTKTTIPSSKLSLSTFERVVATGSSRVQSMSNTPSCARSDDKIPVAAQAFDMPSPGRYRNLIAGGTASNPGRNAEGLPARGDASSHTVALKASPRNRVALGPAQTICMFELKGNSGATSQVRGATTDLAELVSGLDETSDYDKSRSFRFDTPLHTATLPPVPPLPDAVQQPLGHVESVESLRSVVSDVPSDLRDLIDAVDDHISEVDHPSFACEGCGMYDRGFADELFDSSASDTDSDSENDHAHFGISSGFLAIQAQHADGSSSSDGASSTTGFDFTAASLPGRFSNAASGVLRQILNADVYPRESDRSLPEEEQDSLHDSVRDALDVGRPSAGDKMFDRVDIGVSLTALVDSSVPPSPIKEPSRTSVIAANFSLGHFRHDSVLSSEESTESSAFSHVHSSPTPNPAGERLMRQSLSRYSQDRHVTRRGIRPTSVRSATSTESERASSTRGASMSSLSLSNGSTKLSISSLASSPCPAPRHRKIHMLTYKRAQAPALGPSFRFPLEKDRTDPAQPMSFFQLDPMDKVPESAEPASPDAARTRIQPALRGVRSSTSLHFVRMLQNDRPSKSSSQVRVAAQHGSILPPAENTSQVNSAVGTTDEDTNSSDHLQSDDDDEESHEDVLDSEEDYDFTAQEPEDTRRFINLSYEARAEIRQSQATWPDTERSREAVFLFDAPKTYRAILDFLFASQNRFPGLGHLAPFAPTEPQRSSPPPSPLDLPSPHRDGPVTSLAPHQPDKPSSTVVSVSVKPVATQPLRRVLATKSANAIMTTSTSTYAKPSMLSPFTALPPRLGSNLRFHRDQVDRDPILKKVDTAFVRGNASQRRQEQWNAAARKLEGTGFPCEQRSDDDTDDTGLLEAKGEALGDLSFSR